MDGPIVSKEPSMGTKGLKHIKQEFFMIKNFQNEYLILYPEQSTVMFTSDIDPERKTQSVIEQEGNGIFFLIDTYEDLAGNKNGLLVAISSGIGRGKYILCVENDSVTFKEGELPIIVPDFPSKTSEFIFYQKYSASKDITFESSTKRGFFLACSEDGQNLILNPKREDEKTTKFSFEIGGYFPAFKPQQLVAKIPYYIRNSYNDFLIAYPEESVATFESNGQGKGEKAKFYIHKHKDTSTNDGLPVIFSCKVQNKNHLLSVASNSVIITERELPGAIPTETSELIFYIKDFSIGGLPASYRFESSLKFAPSLQQRFCLAWNKEDPKKRLILKLYNGNSINEAMNFFMEEIN